MKQEKLPPLTNLVNKIYSTLLTPVIPDSWIEKKAREIFPDSSEKSEAHLEYNKFKVRLIYRTERLLGLTLAIGLATGLNNYSEHVANRINSEQKQFRDELTFANCKETRPRVCDVVLGYKGHEYKVTTKNDKLILEEAK